MSEPEFFPSHAPHKVEMPEGSNVAKSKSARVGTDIRRVDTSQTIAEEEEEQMLAADNIVDPKVAGATSNIVKLPPQTGEALKTVAIKTAQSAAKASDRSSAEAWEAGLEAEFETEEMVEMDFPARVIQLKIENDAIRVQLKALDALMKGG
jgi:hypothetical protein